MTLHPGPHGVVWLLGIAVVTLFRVWPPTGEAVVDEPRRPPVGSFIDDHDTAKEGCIEARVAPLPVDDGDPPPPGPTPL